MSAVNSIAPGIQIDNGLNFNSLSGGSRSGLRVASYISLAAEPLEKVVKIASRIIDGTALIAGSISKPLSHLSTELKDSITIFESLKVFGAIKMLASRDRKDGRFFLFSSSNTWQRRADRVCLLVHNSFKFVKGLNKADFVKLGVLTKNAIGKLPIFTLAMDTFIVLSSIFGAWDSFIVGLPNARKKIDEADRKLEKWEYRPTAIAFLRMGDEIERKAFQEHFEKKTHELAKRLIDNEKSLKLNQEKLQAANDPSNTKLTDKQKEKINKDCAAENKKLAASTARLLVKQEQNEARLAKVAAHDCKGLADDLANKKIEGHAGKIHKWQVINNNEHIPLNKAWLRVANNIGKIAIVTIALTVTAVLGNFWTLPLALGVISLGITVDSIGLTKLLYDEFAKPAPVPKLA